MKAAAKQQYIDVIEHTVAGIPAQIGVVSFTKVKPWRGCASTCPSSDDYYGYVDLEYELLDRNGRRATWLDAKRTEEVDLEIWQAIEEHMKGYEA